MNNKTKPGLGLIVAFSAFTLAAMLAGCASGTAPSAAPTASSATGEGQGSWLDYSLYLTAPGELSSLQKRNFENFATAVPAFIVGLSFEVGSDRIDLTTKQNFQLQGTLLREVNHRDDLAIWQMEGQVAVPTSYRSQKVLQTVQIEVATADPELASSAVKGQYPANQLVRVIVNRAVREAAQAGHQRGTVRIVQLQFDAAAGVFRAKVEIL